MDMTPALAPNSDQLDAIELAEPRTFTIDTGTRLGQRDGKVVAEVRLVGFDRVWRPSKGMLDVIIACWGPESDHWVGHSVTLYNKKEVKYGKDEVGGTRISHLSHIEKSLNVVIRAAGTGGRKQLWPVKPLPAAAPTRDFLAELQLAGTDVDALAALGHAAKEANAGEVVLSRIRAAFQTAKETNAPS